MAVLNVFALLGPEGADSGDLVQPNQGYTPRKGLIPTVTSLDLIEQCENSMTCNAQLFTREEATFTGVLTDAEGNPLSDKQVEIVALIPKPDLIVLATATTDFDGLFSVEWTAQLTSPQGDPFLVTPLTSETFEVFASFPGDEGLADSRSTKLTVTVTVNSVFTTMNSDKTLYNEGDQVLVFINFIDSNDVFLDPDRIMATWNNQPIKLEQKKEGSYTFTIENLEKKHQQLIVVPVKEGYNLSSAYLTIIVAGLR
jgi:hypothetical protein